VEQAELSKTAVEREVFRVLLGAAVTRDAPQSKSGYEKERILSVSARKNSSIHISQIFSTGACPTFSTAKENTLQKHNLYMRLLRLASLSLLRAIVLRSLPYVVSKLPETNPIDQYWTNHSLARSEIRKAWLIVHQACRPHRGVRSPCT